MIFKRISILLALGLTLALLVVACGGNTETPDTDQPESTDTTESVDTVATDDSEEMEEMEENSCPAVTRANPNGVAIGQFPNQYELDEFESLAACELTFEENPDIASLAARIPHANMPELASVADRLPSEPLVVAPFDEIGSYGGILNGLSNATEAGTSDLLSIRHVNLFRYSDDLTTVVPNIAKSWEWNDDFTQLTINLRAGHKWSDGAPFTAADIEFWYNDLILNPDIYPETPARYLIAGEPIDVVAVDDTTVQFNLPVPAPGLTSLYAVSYVQPFQPKHFFEARMEAEGKTLAEISAIYYRSSDWKDIPSPLLSGESEFVAPTLESFILVEETPEGRVAVANPYFHAVDTQGNQLPYINELDELYVPDAELRNLKITNGEVDYKTQNLFIDDFPLYKENEENGNYRAFTAPTVGGMVFYSFNLNHKDEDLREVFNTLGFREAMSLAINRDEINEIIYFGLGTPAQFTPADPNTVPYVTEAQLNYMIEYDPDAAIAKLDEIGLVDVDGDGFRENFAGDPMTVQILYANQGGPVRIHELVEGYWEAVGINVDIKEVSSDEYREECNNNNCDVTTWRDGWPGASLSGNTEPFTPPFGNFFNPGGGFEWANYITSDGAEGIEPPEDVYTVIDLSNQYIQEPFGSDASNALGEQIIDIHVNNLWKIGVVGSTQAPNMASNNLNNFIEFTVISFDFYWAYAYNPVQWSLDE